MPRDYTDDPDFRTEPVPGLPERLPRGESILWQGRPRTLALARESMWLTWIAAYFAGLYAWRVATLVPEFGLGRAIMLGLPFLLLGAVACGIVLGVAWIQARATLYTITTERVAMRIGAALTITLNMPFARIAGADMAPGTGGTGTIALTPVKGARLSYAVMWPHVRPWKMKIVQPALRCIPEPARVAALLSDAVAARTERPEIAIAAE
ncbi:PH domain-containing protein [Palleronia sediminis]|uniref:PH domain-containing protein n=1 Tax=Palleronia sediminis TaxID=2547833 RepID=A0A4R6A3L9_9RHOB|nr:photosynthetic complex putative assembly protein PuhB [Palleronia sediminis]TDL78231.1 PH domain-containing protein [Palleronia sediminis]